MNEVEVDPALLARIRSAGTPHPAPKAPALPSSIPGTDGFFANMRVLYGSMRDGIGFASDVREKFGDVYRAPFVGLPMLWIWDADEIHKIMKNEDRAWSAALGWDALMFEGLDPTAANTGSLLSVDFEDHRVARKLVQPAFTLKAIEGYLAIADGHFANAIPAWARGGRVPFKVEVRKLLARVANDVFTGIREPAEIAKVDRALSDFWHGMMAVSRNPWVSPTYRRARAGLAALIRTFVDLAPKRREEGGTDLFSRLCAVTDSGLSDEAMVRVFVSIMFGAFDTTSAAMTSMAYLLAKHPAWQDRLREEARSVGEGTPDVAAMKQMKEHEWVWKETLRLMPVNGFLPRRALRPVTVAGHELPAGAFVAPLNGGIGRHPRWYKNPLAFDPERFSPERAEDRQHPGIFNPFGAGAHACIGMQLANMEMKIFWHRLLRAASFRLTRDYEARHTFTPMGMVSGDVALTLLSL